MPASLVNLADRLRPDHRLLLSLCKAGATPDAAHIAAGAYGEAVPGQPSFDRGLFDRLVLRQRVYPLLHPLFGTLPARAPDCPSRRYARLCQDNIRAALRLVEVLSLATAALRSVGIRSIPLKGVALAQRWYGNVALRYAGDLDLLVAADDLTAADRRLRGSGFSPRADTPRVSGSRRDRHTHHFAYRHDETGVLLELHQRLQPNPHLMPVPFATLYAQGSDIGFGPTLLRTLAPAHEFAFLAVHGTRHDWSRLQWVCDLDRMLRAAAAEDALHWVETADRLGVAPAVLQAMMIAHGLLDSPVPEPVRRQAGGNPLVRYMVAHAQRHLFRESRTPEDRPDIQRTWSLLYLLCLSPRPRYLATELAARLRERREATRTRPRRVITVVRPGAGASHG
ncbi:nucleotidyltransferase family protein [Oleisolibacter albus]|uniref:nucleotidyltransferase domain-containing protein n=1 Tax=Oleisolibacter albus TaxID=2171757 RepID=UPI000DF21C59|nr:nucleotidyltransferase family protein [Oleisolibacter albus]